MPSPFPGMNPYLEQEGLWPDLHHRLIGHIAEALTPALRPGYIVNIGRDVYIHELAYPDRRGVGKPDVAVVTDTGLSAAGSGGGVAAADPAVVVGSPVTCVVPLDIDETELGMVEVRDRNTREVVTVIEVLSPANKYAGPDRDQYLRKRLKYLKSRAHLVEIDLLRGGPRMPLDPVPACDYLVMVSRAEARPRAELFPAGLRDRLPAVPIPVRSPDFDRRLELQQVLHDVYDAAGYADYLYREPPQPALSQADIQWAADLLSGSPARTA